MADEMPQNSAPSRKLKRVMQGTHWKETLSNQRNIVEWLESSSYERFLSAITGLNFTIRNKPPKKGKFSDINKSIGNKLGTTYISPRVEDRDQLLRKTHQSLIRLLKDGKRRQAGYLLFAVVQCLHLFFDANGRTGRALYHLIAADDVISKKDIGLFIDNESTDTLKSKGRVVFNEHFENMRSVQTVLDFLTANEVLDKRFREQYGAVTLEKPAKTPTFPHLTYDTKLALQRILREQTGGAFNIRDLAIVQFLEREERLENDQWVGRAGDLAVSPQDRVKKIFSLESDWINDVTEKGALEIISTYYGLKKRMVEILIELIEHPHKYPDPNSPGKTWFNTFTSPPPKNNAGVTQRV